MIVVVDDDKVLVHLLTRLLEDYGYEVRDTTSGEEAYRWLREPKCKGMLLDMHMPGINGAELLMLMAAEGIRVPVLAMTSFVDYDEQEIKQFPNVRRLLYKPLEPEDVLDAVRELAPEKQPDLPEPDCP